MTLRQLRVFGVYAGAAVAILAVAVIRRHTSAATPGVTAQTLEEMRRSGQDTRRSTAVAFVLYFPTESRARTAAAELVREGWPTPALEAPVAPDTAWQVTVTREMVPAVSRIEATGARLARVAHRHGGEYDGWEADAVR